MKSALDDIRYELSTCDEEDTAVGVWVDDLKKIMALVEEIIKLPPSALPKEVNEAINDITEIKFE